MSAQRQQQRGPAWLDGYVTAEEKLKAFRSDHPTARILTQRLDGEPLTFRAEIYLEGNETTIPNATGHASVDGGSGNRKQSPTEKTETAAVSRALTVMGYGGEEDELRPQPARAEAERVPLRAAPTGDTNRDIMAALEILDKSEEGLNAYARKTFKLGPTVDWTDLSAAQRGELLAMLNRQVDKAVSQAR